MMAEGEENPFGLREIACYQDAAHTWQTPCTRSHTGKDPTDCEACGSDEQCAFGWMTSKPFLTGKLAEDLSHFLPACHSCPAGSSDTDRSPLAAPQGTLR